jgi:L-serine dehydratase
MSASRKDLQIYPHAVRDGLPPSIFNDVIGPVMRGPSSSHCAAAVRIGRMARDLMGGEIEDVLVEFHPTGSLATTHESQGSDMGLFGGLLGWEATDDRLVRSARALKEAGIRVELRITDYSAPHPNTYRITLRGPSGLHTMTAISTGGGMVEVLEVDGVRLSMRGDRHETLIWAGGVKDGDRNKEALVRELIREEPVEEVLSHRLGKGWLLQVKGSSTFPAACAERLLTDGAASEVRPISPVLPVLSPPDLRVPFLTCQELLTYNRERKLDLWELAVHYESARGRIPPETVVEEMGRIVDVLEASVRQGIAGTKYSPRILGPQAGAFQAHLRSGRLLDAGVLNTVVSYVTALMEVKSSMGVIVAAPTAGACGALPGACIGVGHFMELGREALTRGMLAAGMVGVFIAHRSTFAAEVCGCQAECGAGSGMAAAALVTLAGGGTHEALAAASMALQNTLGMICDPVANRVEVPCLGRNVMAASNALACANMALAGFDPVIPLDEVIETMDAVGKSLPHQLRCTALGGLSVTPTSRRIQGELDGSEPGRDR